jgi:predicted lipoprotein
MKKLYLFTFITLIALVSILISCNNDGTISQDEFQISYYRTIQLENTYDNEITPIHQDFSLSTAELAIKGQVFGNSITSQNLTNLKEQWKTIAADWKKCELYDIGLVRNSFIHYTINTWPTNPTFIENNITTVTTIDEVYIASVGFSSKGISAIEYLLFDSDEATTLADFQNSQARVDYLNSCISELHTNSNTVISLWAAYKDEFIAATENGISGSQNQLINNMVALLEEIIMSKLNNAINQNDSEEFEAYRSDYSLNLIASNIEVLHRCFTGDFDETPYRIGFKKYLVDLGFLDLAADIDDKFNAVTFKINSMNSSLNSGLATTPENITELVTLIEDVLFVVKIDMSQAIGSTITFNDNDGD